MFLQNLRAKVGARLNGDREAGFTLIELLVVMLILGILAAIAIPSFFNQRDKAKDADAKTQARTAQTAVETYATDHQGKYESGTVEQGDLEAIESTLNNATLTVSTPTGTGDTADNSYTVTAESPDTGNTFSITRHGDGTLEYTCENENTAGCPDEGVWGG